MVPAEGQCFWRGQGDLEAMAPQEKSFPSLLASSSPGSLCGCSPGKPWDVTSPLLRTTCPRSAAAPSLSWLGGRAGRRVGPLILKIPQLPKVMEVGTELPPKETSWSVPQSSSGKLFCLGRVSKFLFFNPKCLSEVPGCCKASLFLFFFFFQFFCSRFYLL